MAYIVQDVLQSLDDLTGGRCITGRDSWATGKDSYVVTKSSNIPGKSITEIPGLVWGDPKMEVKKIAVMMTLTESAIELAAATGVNVIVTHHPVADAANSGGVLLRYYLDIYGIAVFELHEAFHGLHPGIPYLHGYKPFFSSVRFGDIPGNIVHVGEALPEIKTVGDMVDRLNQFMNVANDEELLASERSIRGSDNIQETSMAARCKILIGDRNKVMKKVIHIFPHSGFDVNHLNELMNDYQDADTLIASISRVYPGHGLVTRTEELGLTFVCGNSHALEIHENGMPMAYAIRQYMPEAEIVVFRERVTSTPLDEFGSSMIRDYAMDIADNYLKHQ